MNEPMVGGAEPSLSDFADLYQRRFHRFLRVAEAITGDVDKARDAVHDAFARAIQHRGDYRGEGTLENWVWTCVVNAARTGRHQREIPVADLPDLPEDSREGSDRNDVAAVLTALPDRQRLVLFLRYYGDLDYRSIADTLNIEIGTVGASLHTSHAEIRRLLEEVRR